MKKILVVGGAGYIGSHMVKALSKAGYLPVVFDNLSTGHKKFVPQSAVFAPGDLRNPSDVESVFLSHEIEGVMHFAASSLVGESVADPLKYYENNVAAAVNLLKKMIEHNVKKLIFSSTAAVYGEPKKTPISEEHPKDPTNPYGKSKLAIENMLLDVSVSHGLSFIALRYFNAAGADSAGTCGEVHHPETHLIPNVLKTLTGETESVTIFGGDYPTKDGTCVRDYIHVEDLSRAHLLAFEALAKGKRAEAMNLGNGEGYSILEIIRAVEEITGKKVKTKMGPRRPGDPSILVASSDKAKKNLGWKPEKDLRAIVNDAWNWEKAKK